MQQRQRCDDDSKREEADTTRHGLASSKERSGETAQHKHSYLSGKHDPDPRGTDVLAPQRTRMHGKNLYFLGSSGLAAGAGGGILKMELSTGTFISIFEMVSFSFSWPPLMPFSMAKGSINPLTSL